MSDDTIVPLIAASVEGELDPINRSLLNEALQKDPQLIETIDTQMRTHLLLQALLDKNTAAETRARAALIPDSFARAKQKKVIKAARALRPQQRQWWRPIAIVAVAAAAVLVVVVMVQSTPDAPTQKGATGQAMVVASDGVRIIGSDGELRTDRAAPLQPGDAIETPLGKTARLEFQGENTNVALQENTRVQALAGTGKRLRLEHGNISVTAAPQPTDAPMVVRTGKADITVVGTAFDVKSDPFSTWLSVSHGRVKFTHGDTTIEVAGGQRAFAASGIQMVPTDRGCGLIGYYFQGSNLTDLKAMRLDAIIDYQWALGRPIPEIKKPYSIRWTGMIQANHAETYRFYLPSDDGARLWIDDQLIYDEWNVRAVVGTRKLSGEYSFAANHLRVPIRIEYFNSSRIGNIKLRWSSPSQPIEVVPSTALYPVE